MTCKELQIKMICKTYKKTAKPANHDISFTLRSGEMTALIGHNGAGKTTLLNQIIGNVKPDTGDIRYDNISLVNNTRLARNHVSMMPQFYAPLAGVTVRQSIECALRIRRENRSDVRKSANEIMEALDIRQWENKAGEHLSGGLLRLTSFAMAVSKPAEVLLLDEPTNDVDPVRKKKVWKYMKELSRKGYIVLVVTHNLLEVEQYADRFVLLDAGHMVKDERIAYDESREHVLTITLTEHKQSDSLIEELDLRFNEEELQLFTLLKPEQIPSVMKKVIQLVSSGVISNYRLTPASLEMSYGGMVGANQNGV